ncbi:hypothetical protein T09_13079 [Trichinella sp. T9]|nr:hypothetical protein T09_13079 [Trichinella sp. T9]
MTSLFSALAGPSRIDAVKLLVLQRQYQPIFQIEEELGDTGF